MKGQVIVGSDKAYRPYQAINNSLLNAFGKGLESLRSALKIGMTEEELEERDTKDYFRKGSAVDCLLTQGEAAFDKQFAVLPDFNENGQEIMLLKAWVKSGHTDWDTAAMEVFSRDVEIIDPKTQKVERTGLWKTNKWTTQAQIDARIAKFDTPHLRDKVFPYLRSFSDMTYLKRSEYDQLKLTVAKLQNDPIVSEMIEAGGENEILYTQLSIIEDIEFPSLKGKITRKDIPGVRVKPDGTVIVTFKCLLDYVKVDTGACEITPMDLKTSGKAIGENFINSLAEFGYITQDSLYSEMLGRWAEMHYKNYKVNPFKFVVSSLTEPDEPPLHFELDDEIRKVGKYGGSIAWETKGKFRKTDHKGWYRLTEELVSQLNTGQYFLTPNQFERREKREPQRPQFVVLSSNAPEEMPMFNTKDFIDEL